MANIPPVAVVIVNYNGESFIGDTLRAVLAQTHAPSQIVVLDNKSSDNSVDIISREFPQVDLYPQEENLFFCAGSNRGIALTDAPFVLLLNNDCILDPGYIEKALQPMIDDDTVGGTTGKIWRIDGKTIDQAGQELARSRKPLDRGYEKADDGRFDESEEVFGTGGVAPLFRRAMLDELAMDGQVFDEDFVQYYEDLDLAWRARNFGWKTMFVHDATARHMRGATGQSEKDARGWVNQFALANLPEFLQAHVLKNRYAVMVKNDRLVSWLLNLPWILLYELKIFAYLLLIRPSLIPKYIRGFGFIKVAARKRRILREKVRAKGITRYGGITGV